MAEAAGTSVGSLAPMLNQLCDLSCLVELLSRRLALVDPTLWDFDSSESSGWRLGTSPAGSVALPQTCYNVTSQYTHPLPLSFWVTGSWRLGNAAFPLCGTLT